MVLLKAIFIFYYLIVDNEMSKNNRILYLQLLMRQQDASKNGPKA